MADSIGDLNDDGIINILDLTLLERYVAGLSVSTPLSDTEFRRRADINGDGTINALDLTALEKLIAEGEGAGQTVELAPGESRPVSFEATPHEARTYQVSVDELTGSFNAVAAPAIKITNITVYPTELTTAKHEYNTAVGLGYWGDLFTISLTFSNPFDHDVWVKPDYAFGKLTGEPLEYVNGALKGFEAKNLIYFRLILNTEYIQGDFSYTTGWQNPWNARGLNLGSNMVLGIYDPDGVPRLIGGGDYWLKIPPEGSITMEKEAHLGGDLQVRAMQCTLCREIITGGVEEHYESNHPGVEITCWSWGGYGGCYFADGSGDAVITVYVPAEGVAGLHDLCVVAMKVWSLVYDPGYGQQRVGGQWVTVNWRPVELDPVASAVPELVNITAA